MQHNDIPVLKGVTLAAIVRDEMINLAGGVVDFVERTVPFVERAVILDTGSRDGTREALEKLESTYSHLKVFDREFDGNYSKSRNFSLENVNTDYTLVLDCDERLTRKDFSEIDDLIGKKEGDKGYRFSVLYVYSDGKTYPQKDCHDIRLFKSDAFRFEKSVWEIIKVLPEKNVDIVRIPVNIKHFVASQEMIETKKREWYHHLTALEVGWDKKLRSPTDFISYKKWSKPHPAEVRDLYR